MKYNSILGSICVSLIFLMCACVSGNQLENYAKGRISGVTHIKKNPDGSIKSLLIIGRAAINPILQDEDDAREDASINASELFSEYLNKTVTVMRHRKNTTETSNGGTIQGSQQNLSQSAKAVSVKSKEFASISRAALAGMREVYAGVFNNKYVIIYAWSKSECAGLQDVIMVMSDTAQTAITEANKAELLHESGATQKFGVPVQQGGTQIQRPVIKEGGSASSDANDFL